MSESTLSTIDGGRVGSFDAVDNVSWNCRNDGAEPVACGVDRHRARKGATTKEGYEESEESDEEEEEGGASTDEDEKVTSDPDSNHSIGSADSEDSATAAAATTTKKKTTRRGGGLVRRAVRKAFSWMVSVADACNMGCVTNHVSTLVAGLDASMVVACVGTVAAAAVINAGASRRGFSRRL